MTAFATFCLCLTAGLVAIAILFSRTRIVFFNLAAAVLAVGLYEIKITRQPPPENHNVGSITQGFYTDDPELGYVIKPGARAVSSVLERADGSVIYDVTYTVDQSGRRSVIPRPTVASDDEAIFFVGDSFTFGEGVNNEDALPQQFSNVSGLRVINFGVPGYGAHQVLREMETDRFHTVEARDPSAIVYVVLPWNHMQRAAGRVAWDKNGPRYEIIDGSLQHIGHFTPPKESLLKSLFGSASLYKKFVLDRLNQNTDADRERLLAIISRVQNLSASKYHAPLFIVLWDVNGEKNSDAKWMYENLRAEGIPTLAISAVAPELEESKYYLVGDPHPNGEGYALVATALAAFLQKNRLIVQR